MDENDSTNIIKRSNDCREQLRIWSRLLEIRISLQKVISTQRDLEKISGVFNPRLEDSSINTVHHLLRTLLKLRKSYRKSSQFNLSSEEDDPEDGSDTEIIPNDEALDNEHDKYSELRRNLVDKWYEKTKIGVIQKKGYSALELPTSQLISNALKDKDRLIRRTQTDRTCHNDVHNEEIFNDDDFYHHLLKEVVSKEEGSKWVELQRLRYKAKRKADTKASKGRKVKKDLIPKLVNYMAPIKNDDPEKGAIPEEIRKELLKSIFGGGH